MVKRKKKSKLNYMIFVTMVFAMLMVASCFLNFGTYKVQTFFGNTDDSFTGLNLIENDFPRGSESEDQTLAFGNVALQLGAWTGLVGGGALLLVLLVALFLPKIKTLITISKISSLACAVLSIICLIGGIIIVQKTAASYGPLLDYKFVINEGLYLCLGGGVGSCVSSILTK